MKFILIVIALLSFVFAKSQNISPCKWDKDPTIFKTVKMSVSKEKQKIFSGYKDATITIEGATESAAEGTVSMKLSGYYEVQSAPIVAFEYHKRLSGEIILVYSLNDLETIVVFTMEYNDITQKVSRITVTVAKNTGPHKYDKTDFILEGFE